MFSTLSGNPCSMLCRTPVRLIMSRMSDGAAAIDQLSPYRQCFSDLAPLWLVRCMRCIEAEFGPSAAEHYSGEDMHVA